MIHFHYHVAHADTPHLGIRLGDRLCHVFSDEEAVEDAAADLRGWAAGHGLGRVRLQEHGRRRQHLDLWGATLRFCGPAADRAVMRRWLRGPA